MAYARPVWGGGQEKKVIRGLGLHLSGKTHLSSMTQDPGFKLQPWWRQSNQLSLSDNCGHLRSGLAGHLSNCSWN